MNRTLLRHYVSPSSWQNNALQLLEFNCVDDICLHVAHHQQAFSRRIHEGIWTKKNGIENPCQNCWKWLTETRNIILILLTASSGITVEEVLLTIWIFVMTVVTSEIACDKYHILQLAHKKYMSSTIVPCHNANNAGKEFATKIASWRSCLLRKDLGNYNQLRIKDGVICEILYP